MPNKILLQAGKARRYREQRRDLDLIRKSGLFDEGWYLANNPDVARAQVDPLLHYLNYGGFEGRDPSPNFNNRGYLEAYDDVKKAGINPLVHYLKYGREEGREAQPRYEIYIDSPYSCPVCDNKVKEFLPLSSHYKDEHDKYGYPYLFDDFETINPAQYQCPLCGASDRDRLYALYLLKTLNINLPPKTISLLDIAPSHSLKKFLRKHPCISYLSVDKYMQGVDLVLDITDMNAIQPESFDIFICSHVLEHVRDDKKALSELYRILKPGGWGILMVPINLKIDRIDEDPSITDIAERWRRFGQDDHIRLYSKKGFVDRTEQAGFVIKQYGIDYFGEDAFFQYGISRKSILYIVRKN